MRAAHHAGADADADGDGGTAADAAQPVHPPIRPEHLDPRSLLVFHEVGRWNSYTGAAAALDWSQPAVSGHVRRLEKQLGLPLARRRGRGIEITPAGQSLLRHTARLVATMHALRQDMSDHARARSGRVRIGAFPSAAATIVTRGLRQISATHPGLEIGLEQLEPPQAWQALATGHLDLAVVFDYPEPETKSATGPLSTSEGSLDHLCDDAISVVLPRGHRSAGADRLDIGELADQDWVAGCPTCRNQLLAFAAARGVHPRIRHSTDDYVVVQSLVAADVVVAVLPGLALQASRHPDIVSIPLADHPPRRVILAAREGAEQIPAVRQVRAALRAAATPAGPNR